MVIGLTGIYCAGKNHVASLLEARGLPVLDVDKLGYRALELEKEAVFAKFGQDLKKDDGSLDRRLLGQRVFGKPDELAFLEAIIHPVANQMTDEWITAKNGNCVINAALLHRSPVFYKLKHVILVKAPFLIRFLRARKRDKLPFKEILNRFASQNDFYTQYLSINAEIHIVENSGLSGFQNLKLERQIDKIIEGIF
jgi:dephospho-CoA kinase